ncbi:MAG: dihydroorotate dehydrogenase electron transfer subunit [Actinomycetota bacterium]
MIRARCEVLSSRAAGAYQTVTLVAPEIAERAKPGQFVEVGMPHGRSFTLRRPFFIHQASRRGGWAGTVELVVDRAGPGTSWLADARAHEFVDLIGPLGNGFGYPRPTNCLLLAQGYGAAPLYFLAEELRGRGKRVDMIVFAPSQDRLFNPIEGKRLAHSITIVTEDGTVGERADPIDVLAAAVERSGAQVVYAAGARSVVQRVAEYCKASRLPAQVVLEELMACGLGLCGTCVVPVARIDGAGYERLRACVSGPVFNAGRVLWERWGRPGAA